MRYAYPMWQWLTAPKTPYTWRFVRNVVGKGLIIFFVFNLFFALAPNILSALGRVSVYNVLVAGRLRLPFGENPGQSYALSLQNLEALFASHILAGTPKHADEYRVLLIGDSSVWGVLLENDQTLAGQLNARGLQLPDGRRLRTYNLGYPIQSLFKDLLILNRARQYQPDLIVWLITPESFAPKQQTDPLLVRENPDIAVALINQLGLTSIRADSPAFIRPTFLESTIVGRRRQIADWLRINLYGIPWSATRHDQTYPRFYVPRMEDFIDMPNTWQGFSQGQLTSENLAFDVLAGGIGLVGQTPVIIINEPMFISSGIGSQTRYNFFYPRWASDDFRALMQVEAERRGWRYIDLWDAVPASEFTDSAVHLTPLGSSLLADKVQAAIEAVSGPMKRP
jgi:hypothetical protein